jgi:chromosome segregation ATPase
MLTAKNLEKIIELENRLRSEYQEQLDAKTAEIERLASEKEEQKAVIARQLEQITTLSAQASANKRVEQLNRELHQRCENLQEEIASQKKRIKSLQGDLADVRAEVKTLKQFDPARMKKNLEANKKKLAEKSAAADLLQKSVNKYKAKNAELTSEVKQLEARLEQTEEQEEDQEAAA